MKYKVAKKDEPVVISGVNHKGESVADQVQGRRVLDHRR